MRKSNNGAYAALVFAVAMLVLLWLASKEVFK